jgi:hypothetical protein
MLLVGNVGIGFMGTILVGGAIIASEGFIHVKVHEKQANGTHMSLIVPAMIVPLTMHFVPRRYLRDPSENLRQFIPLIDATIAGLADCPDGPLVEVMDPDSHVTVVKSGGSIVVDADDLDEIVHVAVPLRATKRTIDEIAEANGPN